MDDSNILVAIGASAGGIAALRQLFSRLPRDFPAPILAVMHVGGEVSILPAVLAPSSRLPVRHAEDGAALEAGTVLIAPADHHLVVADGHVHLTRGPKENHARPAIDPLFRSAALAYRERAVGVVLTGRLDDGTVGLQAIKGYGGIAIVQDPAEAEAASMPQSALTYVDVDYCLPLDGIADTLARLATAPPAARASRASSNTVIMENRFAIGEDPDASEMDAIGRRSAQTCPECGGILWEIHGAPPVRYRCHTGHAFTGESLLDVHRRLNEDVLWSAVRALHEKHTLHRRLASDARQRGSERLAAEHEASARQAVENAQALRAIIAGDLDRA